MRREAAAFRSRRGQRSTRTARCSTARRLEFRVERHTHNAMTHPYRRMARPLLSVQVRSKCGRLIGARGTPGSQEDHLPLNHHDAGCESVPGERAFRAACAVAGALTHLLGSRALLPCVALRDGRLPTSCRRADAHRSAAYHRMHAAKRCGAWRTRPSARCLEWRARCTVVVARPAHDAVPGIPTHPHHPTLRRG